MSETVRELSQLTTVEEKKACRKKETKIKRKDEIKLGKC